MEPSPILSDWQFNTGCFRFCSNCGDVWISTVKQNGQTNVSECLIHFHSVWWNGSLALGTFVKAKPLDDFK